MKYLTKKDIPFISICLLLIVIASLLLYQDYLQRSGKSNQPIIGILHYKYKVAQRKYNGQVVWDQVHTGVPIYNYDSIRTVDGASATLFLHAPNDPKKKLKATIELASNTLITVSMDKETAGIQFKGGRISTQSQSKSKLKIATKNGDINLSQGALNLSQEKNNVKVDVQKGEAVFQSKNQETKVIKENNRLELSANNVKIRKLSLIPIAPYDNKYFIINKNSQRIVFKRENINTTQNVFLELSTDRFFRNIVRRVSMNSNSINLDVPEGSYYWRMKSMDNQSQSRSSRFEIIHEQPVTLKLPKKSQQITSFSNSPFVQFEWSERNCGGYRLEIYKDSSLTNLHYSQNLKEESIGLNNLPAGTYYWQVRSFYDVKGAKASFVSKARKLIISKLEKIKKVKVISPFNNQTFTKIQIERNQLDFNWQDKTAINNYELQISRDKNFDTILYSISTKNNFSLLREKLKPGSYFFRVKSIGNNKNSFAFSEIQKFNIVQNLPISLKLPRSRATVFAKNNRKITFQWQDKNYINNYKLIFSDNLNFSNILKEVKTKSDTVSLSVSNDILLKTKNKEQRIYWKILALNSNGKTVIESKASSFVIPAALEAPSVIKPANNQEILLTADSNLIFSWSKVENANSYRLKIFTSNKEIVNVKLQKNSFFYKNSASLKSGKYYWEVQAIFEENKKIISKSIFKRYFFELKQQKLRKPMIISPKIIYVEESEKDKKKNEE